MSSVWIKSVYLRSHWFLAGLLLKRPLTGRWWMKKKKREGKGGGKKLTWSYCQALPVSAGCSCWQWSLGAAAAGWLTALLLAPICPSCNYDSCTWMENFCIVLVNITIYRPKNPIRPPHPLVFDHYLLDYFVTPPSVYLRLTESVMHPDWFFLFILLLDFSSNLDTAITIYWAFLLNDQLKV